ncbi:DUF3048 domain-containing protein [Candidatus Dojkabacteria bacterium]|nr:DUF3048 domain-containing protein [Candidatus Dojkabacteria bacterium]
MEKTANSGAAESNKEINLSKSEIDRQPVLDKQSSKSSSDTRKILIIVAIVLGLLVAALGIFWLLSNVIINPATQKPVISLGINNSDPNSDNNAGTGSEADKEIDPRTEESPINGELFTPEEFNKIMERPPIAVPIGNGIDLSGSPRPQSNLPLADIIYETNVEGGITRYLALYWSNDVTEVGPVRSVRNYHLQWLSGYDAILTHDGQASDPFDERVDAKGNLFRYGIKDVRNDIGMWRSTEKFAPHNEYIDFTKIWEELKEDKEQGLYDWYFFPEITPWSFKDDAPSDQRGSEKTVKIQFWHELSTRNNNRYDVEWTYDPESNEYLRTLGGEKDIDKVSGEQISAKVVILQDVDMEQTFNSKGHIIIEVIGEGTATIMQDGQMLKANWKKPDRMSRTMYYKEDGSEFEFNRGLIWISALPEQFGQYEVLTPGSETPVDEAQAESAADTELN